jgi:hypothetical protein
VEVGQVILITGFGFSTARIAAHVSTIGQAVDPDVEGIGGVDVLEYLRTGVLIQAGSIRDHLGDLSPSYFIEGAKGAI